MKKTFTANQIAQELASIDKFMVDEPWTIIVNQHHVLELISGEDRVRRLEKGEKFTVVRHLESWEAESFHNYEGRPESIIEQFEVLDFEYEVVEHPVAILNTSILTALGTFTLSELTLEQAQALTRGEIISAVGHQSTADILTELLQVNVPMNRIQFAQQPGQKAVVFKLNGRAPEGTILTREQIEEIGYSFQLLEMQ